MNVICCSRDWRFEGKVFKRISEIDQLSSRIIV